MARAIKDPDEVLDFRRDWARDLDALGDPDTIASSQWLPDPGITVLTDAERKASHDAKTATVWLSGGVLGQTHKVVNRITTTGGRTFDWTLHVQVVAL